MVFVFHVYRECEDREPRDSAREEGPLPWAFGSIHTDLSVLLRKMTESQVRRPWEL